MNLGSIQVIIPARNEEETLPAVIARLRLQGLERIRIVDNGSTDTTAKEARNAGAEVVFESQPGYGRACWTGLQNLSAEVEWILFCDADGSDVLEELPQFFSAAADADFVLGNRRATPEGRRALTPAQNFGNWLASTLIRLGWGGSFSDLGPMRLIRREALERIAMEDRGFGWTVEMQARAVEEKLRIREIPVGYRDRAGGESKISGSIRGSVKAGTVILGTLGKLYLRKLGINSATLLWIAAGLLLAGSVAMEPAGDLQVKGNVPIFLAAAMLMSCGFVAALQLKELAWPAFWIVALLARAILLPMAPGDDIWRYLWEGMIQHHGLSPYAYAPLAHELAPLRTSWWPLINHPEVAAIYPPLAQIGFWLLTFAPPSVAVFKLSFLVADLGCCFLLQRRFGSCAALVYAWNPLVIYSFAGGGHYDVWFLLPLIAAWLLLEKSESWRQLIFGALALGVSISLKYVSLPLAAFFAIRELRQKGVSRAAVFCGLAALPFAGAWLFIHPAGPLAPAGFVNIARSSEFIPYWIGLLWPASIRMNWIFALPLAAIVLVMLGFARRASQISEGYFFALLLLSPIVHAWYFTWLVPFAVRTRNPGTILVSISGFIYFLLKHREAMGGGWTQPAWEKWLLWGPLILGFCWQLRQESAKRPRR